MTRNLAAALLAVCMVAAGCGPAQPSNAPPPSLVYLGQVEVPRGFLFDGTTVGGLSAISYDPGRQVYYVISDDRSAKNPARFYTVRIMFPDNKLGSVEWAGTTTLLDKGGTPFAPLAPDAAPPVIPPDPEGIAFDERRQQLYWSSEGERRSDEPARPLLLNPWVRVAGLDGDYRGEFALPAGLDMSADQTGTRQNHGLEGLTLTPDGDSLWAAMEAPGYGDGEPPTDKHGALTRVTRFDVETGSPTAQFAYPLDSTSAGKDGDNGLTDLVALDDDNFLVIERGYGTFAVARIFRASIAGADNVLDRPSLTGAPPKAMSKTLLADLSKMPEIPYLDNVEGITLGSKLSDGRQSVVLVTDDNFNPQQVTQFYAFAM
ncbi:MAG TPA: esterase-like activity of phytase family protein [Mycobacterium sp.]|nr:esterase-like activity of phytase family protein [Mycobacterium sp.]